MGSDRSAHRVIPLAILFAFAWLGCSVATATTYTVTSSGGDDTAAINAAINGASAGDTVSLATGTFLISGQINAKTGVAIVGAGQSSTTVQYMGTNDAPMINMSAVNNVEIAGLTLNGNSDSHALQGINAFGGTNEYIHNITVENLTPTDNFGPSGIYFSGAMTNSRIVGNTFTNIGVGSMYGSGIRLDQGSTGDQVLNNTISNTGRGGIFASHGSNNVVIENNTISGSGMTSGAPGLGIEIFQSNGALVQNNTLDHWLSVDTASNSSIRGNTVTGVGVGPQYAGLEFATAGQNDVFSNNVVQGGEQIGISISNNNGVDSKQYVLFAHNTIQNAVTWGAQIQGDGAPTQQLYFYKNTFSGTQASSGSALYPGQGDAFRFNPNSPILNVTLNGNTITGNASIGIEGGDNASSPNLNQLSVINNTITNNGGPAFTPDFGSSNSSFYGTDLQWQGNTVTGNASDYQPPSQGTFFSDPPSVSIIAPTTVAAGVPVNFISNFVGPDAPTDYLWDFGDGLPGTTADPSFTYATPGTYDVDLVVWDTLGRAAQEDFTLTVTAPEPSALIALCGVGATSLFLFARRRNKR
jgi:parallel beta-helix repeat protein